MKRIILHIGQQKTGSTALQKFLYGKKELLKEKGISYYMPCFRCAPWPGKSNGDFVLANVLSTLKEPSDPVKREMFLKNESANLFYLQKTNANPRKSGIEKNCLLNELEKYDTIILSEEMIWHYGYFYEDFWQKIYDYFSQFIKEEFVIDVLVYLRRQDDWILSKWKEDLRNSIPFTWDFDKTLKEYEDFGFLNYYDQLLSIEKVFGKDHIIIRNHDRKYLHNKNVIDDFFYACNIDFDCSDAKDFNINASQPLTSAYGLLAINRKLVKCHELRPNLYVASKLYYSLTSIDNRKAQVLTNNQRLDLLNRCKASNDKISSHFFDGQSFFDEKMYSETKKYKIIKPNPVLDRLYAYKLILISKMSRRYCDLTTKIVDLCQSIRRLKKNV